MAGRDKKHSVSISAIIDKWFTAAIESLHPLRIRFRRLFLPKLRQWAALEEARLFLLIPVLLGVGIGFYFTLKSEPNVWISLTGLAMFVAGWMMAGQLGARFSKARLVLLAGLLVMAGFNVAKLQTGFLNTKTLESEIEFADIEGAIISTQHRPTGWRIILKPTQIETLKDDDYPQKIRLTWRGRDFAPRAGDHIKVTATISPLPPPVTPGGYDFGRDLYFQHIGAVGFMTSKAQIIQRDYELGKLSRIRQNTRLKIEQMRVFLFNHIIAKAPDRGGAIVAAIVTGKREAITPLSESILRDSGLAHLLAISGLHMGLATGLIFFCVRFLLALKPSFALHYPIKKWSAWMALGSGAFYLILSGSGWSARRAFIMTAIIFIAILSDRRALSLRNVAVAATIILLLTPQALLHPGFQMSFAAVTALIAAYEWGSTRYWGAEKKNQIGPSGKLNEPTIVKNHTDKHTDNQWPQWGIKLRKYAIGIGITDSVAATATAPFALYHFHRTALYGLPANIIAMPLMGLWIMPAIIIALVMMPLGLDGFFWRVAAFGIEIILKVGGSVSQLPGAVSLIPAQSITWLIILCVGGLVLCLLKAPWRLSGLIALPIAVIFMVFSPTPTIMISDKGNNAGIHAKIDGKKHLFVYDRRRDRFAASVWLETLGFDEENEKTIRMRDYIPCDDNGCVAVFDLNQTEKLMALKERRDDLGAMAVVDMGQKEHANQNVSDKDSHKRSDDMFKVAFSAAITGLVQDCAYADIVIAFYPVSRQHRKACEAELFDRRGAWNDGARALWLKKTGEVKVRSVKENRGRRPWTL